MEMQGLKKNKQDEKGKLEHSKLAQAKSLQRNSSNRAQSHPSETTLEKLDFFSSNSPKREVT